MPCAPSPAARRAPSRTSPTTTPRGSPRARWPRDDQHATLDADRGLRGHGDADARHRGGQHRAVDDRRRPRLWIVRRYVAESLDPRAPRVDGPGLVTLTGALFLLVFALLRGTKDGWASATIVASFGGALVL